MRLKIQNEKVIEDWLDGLKDATIKNYLNAMSLICILTEKTPTELLNIAWKEQEERVPPWEQSIEEWYSKIRKYDIETDSSIATARIRRAGVSAFFHFYKIQTPTKFGRRKDKILKVKNEREGLTKQDITDAMNGLKSFKLKALILTQATSGLALVDVLKLELDQFYDGLIKLDDGHEICMIHQKRTKTEQEHFTFISYEAVDLIKKYLELERNEPIEGPLFSCCRRGNRQYRYKAYSTAISRLNERLGWSNENKDYTYGKLTTHMLRKFFETQLTDSGCIQEHITHMMGWKLPGMRANYYLAHPEELQKSYIKHLDYLTLENVETVTIDSPEVKEIKEELQKERIARLNSEDKIKENIYKEFGWIFEGLKNSPAARKELEKFRPKDP